VVVDCSCANSEIDIAPAIASVSNKLRILKLLELNSTNCRRRAATCKCDANLLCEAGCGIHRVP
jgi:hypothetical protein